MDGLQALPKPALQLIDEGIRAHFGDSIDLDAALRSDFPGEHRWDYLVGHTDSATVVGVEPHSASTSEVSTVINKRECALRQLRPHANPESKVTAWYWVASGRIDFVPHERAVLRLEQAGITFVGSRLRQKHLPASATGARTKRTRKPV